MTIIYYILIVYGLSNIIANESVFNFIKDKLNITFLNCSTCISFWIGLVLYFILPITITGSIYYDPIFMGFISSGLINLLEHIKNRLI